MAKIDWKSIVGAVAPTLATALGGPLAGVAVREIATRVLNKPEANEEEVEAAIVGANPELLLKMREADNVFKKALLDAGVKLEELSVNDRASARGREVQTGDHWTPRVIAGVVVGGFLFTVYYVLAGHVSGLKDPLVATLVGTLIGYTSAKADQVVSYYFGSSASSKAKDETLAHIAKME